MRWYRGLEPIVEENVPLADRTWYHMGGAARYFCTPSSLEQGGELAVGVGDGEHDTRVTEASHQQQVTLEQRRCHL